MSYVQKLQVLFQKSAVRMVRFHQSLRVRKQERADYERRLSVSSREMECSIQAMWKSGKVHRSTELSRVPAVARMRVVRKRKAGNRSVSRWRRGRTGRVRSRSE